MPRGRKRRDCGGQLRRDRAPWVCFLVWFDAGGCCVAVTCMSRFDELRSSNFPILCMTVPNGKPARSPQTPAGSSVFRAHGLRMRTARPSTAPRTKHASRLCGRASETDLDRRSRRSSVSRSDIKSRCSWMAEVTRFTMSLKVDTCI